MLLAACEPSDPAPETLPTDERETLPTKTPPPPDGAQDARDDGYPDIAPPSLTPEAQAGETGARSLVLTWARALELEEFGQAHALMGKAGRETWSRAEFAAMFDGLNEISVTVPDGTMEGAAGSSYYTVPTTITAQDHSGRPIGFKGEVVLRRVNDVPGATPDQLRWHFDTVHIDWTH